MEIKVQQEQGRVPVSVIHLDGYLDGSTYEQFLATADQAIRSGASYVLLDMSNVGFMGSAGIRAINEIFARLRALPEGEDEQAIKLGLRDGTYKSQRLKLLRPSKQVIHTLATAGIDMFLEIHTDLKEAIASF